MHNFNTQTQLPFGVAAGNSLNFELLGELHQKAYNLVYDELLEEAKVGWAEAGHTEEEIAGLVEKYSDAFAIDEPSASFQHEGVEVTFTYLGGAPIVFSHDGPIQKVSSYCSPCVPGAADLQSGEGDIECHGFPADWYGGATCISQL